ncbi:hypothetical protein HUU62_03215 [Rhodoferax sp. 4810]|nr:hypothetical protein [Rhodoferax jenense]
MAINSQSTGRPKTTVIERLRTAMWSNWLMVSYAATTSKEFEESVLRQRNALTLSKGLWSRYLRGDITPQGANDKSKRHLIHRLSKDHPFPMRIYDHPMWGLMHFRSNMGPDEIKQIYFRFDKSLWRSLLLLDDHPFSASEIEQAQFWHRPCDTNNFIEICKEAPFCDVVGLCLCEAQMAYLRQDEPKFVFYIVFAGKAFAIFANRYAQENRRLAAIFLVLEGLCLEQALKMTTVELTSTTERTEDRARLFDWHQKWLSRCKLHLDALSPINQKLFLFWLKDVLNVSAILSAYDRI